MAGLTNTLIWGTWTCRHLAMGTLIGCFCAAMASVDQAATPRQERNWKLAFAIFYQVCQTRRYWELERSPLCNQLPQPLSHYQTYNFTLHIVKIFMLIRLCKGLWMPAKLALMQSLYFTLMVSFNFPIHVNLDRSSPCHFTLTGVIPPSCRSPPFHFPLPHN